MQTKSTTTRTQCSRSDCSQPATHRIYGTAESGRTWTHRCCGTHLPDGKQLLTDLGFTYKHTLRLTVFADAAHHLRTHGWHQGGYYPGWTDDLDSPNLTEAGDLINEQGLPCCLVGALTACGAERPELDEVVRQILPAQVTQWPNPEGILADWQDRGDRNLDQVLDVLERTAQAVAA